MKKKTNWTIILTLTLFALILMNLMLTPATLIISINTNQNKEAITAAGMENQGDWHAGSYIATPEVVISYSSIYGEDNSLAQRMTIQYVDRTSTHFWFDIHHMFEADGLDVPGQVVLNWSKAYYTTVGLSLTTNLDDTRVATSQSFEGFTIINGTADDMQLIIAGGEKWAYTPKNETWVAGLTYMNTSMKIGVVNVSTLDYLYEGETLKESIITFNVTINASIWDSFDRVYLPVVLNFELRHNVTQTNYKYGANLDWSAVKNFPCGSRLNTGDNISLIASDMFVLSTDMVGGVELQVSNFTTNTANDTAIFVVNGIQLGKVDFTTDYSINGTELHNTTRTYIYNATHIEEPYMSDVVSRMFVVFDGFKYNQSTGFTFDPFVVIPCSLIPEDSDIPWSGLLINIIGLLGLITIVFSYRKAKSQGIFIP